MGTLRAEVAVDSERCPGTQPRVQIGASAPRKRAEQQRLDDDVSRLTPSTAPFGRLAEWPLMPQHVIAGPRGRRVELTAATAQDIRGAETLALRHRGIVPPEDRDE